MLDTGIIQPRTQVAYDWSARKLAIPDLRRLLCGETPCYAWPPDDEQPWLATPSRAARLARRLIPATRGTA
jgi:hypothetical protein